MININPSLSSQSVTLRACRSRSLLSKLLLGSRPDPFKAKRKEISAFFVDIGLATLGNSLSGKEEVKVNMDAWTSVIADRLRLLSDENVMAFVGKCREFVARNGGTDSDISLFLAQFESLVLSMERVQDIPGIEQKTLPIQINKEGLNSVEVSLLKNIQHVLEDNGLSEIITESDSAYHFTWASNIAYVINRVFGHEVFPKKVFIDNLKAAYPPFKQNEVKEELVELMNILEKANMNCLATPVFQRRIVHAIKQRNELFVTSSERHIEQKKQALAELLRLYPTTLAEVEQACKKSQLLPEDQITVLKAVISEIETEQESHNHLFSVISLVYLRFKLNHLMTSTKAHRSETFKRTVAHAQTAMPILKAANRSHVSPAHLLSIVENMNQHRIKNDRMPTSTGVKERVDQKATQEALNIMVHAAIESSYYSSLPSKEFRTLVRTVSTIDGKTALTGGGLYVSAISNDDSRQHILKVINHESIKNVVEKNDFDTVKDILNFDGNVHPAMLCIVYVNNEMMVGELFSQTTDSELISKIMKEDHILFTETLSDGRTLIVRRFHHLMNELKNPRRYQLKPPSPKIVRKMPNRIFVSECYENKKPESNITTKKSYRYPAGSSKWYRSTQILKSSEKRWINAWRTLTKRYPVIEERIQKRNSYESVSPHLFRNDGYQTLTQYRPTDFMPRGPWPLPNSESK